VLALLCSRPLSALHCTLQILLPDQPQQIDMCPLDTYVCVCPVHLFVISSSAKCLRVSKTESYGICRICFEMTRQATMPSSSEKCLCVSKTESYGISRICFEMTRQATMPSSSEKCLCVSKTESYGLSRICFEMTRQATMPSSKA
jgi:prolipoprotein diacylglyceryltransferase